MVYLDNKFSSPVEPFIERNNYIEQIRHKLTEKELPYCFVTGVGGMGKSEIVRQYAQNNFRNGNYHIVSWNTYDGVFERLVANMNMYGLKESVGNWDKLDISKQCDEILEHLKNYNKHTLIIIDNFKFKELSSNNRKRAEKIFNFFTKERTGNFKTHVIFTTREEKETKERIIKIQSLNEPNTVKLFELNFKTIQPGFSDSVKTLVGNLFNHPLGIILTAKLSQTRTNNDKDIKTVIDSISETICITTKNFNKERDKIAIDKDHKDAYLNKLPYEHVKRLFDLSDISSKIEEKYIIINLSILPPSGIPRNMFEKFIGFSNESRRKKHGFDVVSPKKIKKFLYDPNNSGIIDELVRRNWITITKDNNTKEELVYCHPLIADVIFDELKPNLSESKLPPSKSMFTFLLTGLVRLLFIHQGENCSYLGESLSFANYSKSKAANRSPPDHRISHSQCRGAPQRCPV